MEIKLISHVLIYNDRKEFLIIKRSGKENILPNYWDIPGGSVNNGEDPKAAAIRELYEESGLKQKELNLFFYTSNIDKNKQFVRLIFIGKNNNKKIKLNLKDHDDFAWEKINKRNISKYKLVDYLIEIFSKKNF